MIGTLLNDRYRLEAELGRGGMGVVYRARDRLLQRDVAVKLVSETGLTAGGRARILFEARAAASLNHPNIVSVHDVGETRLPGQPDLSSFIVMELVEGTPLRAAMPESLGDIVDITSQICAALAHAHSNQIIHRDLKPENIFLTPSGRVKLVDFGLAYTPGTADSLESGTISGTLYYMAPEVILGKLADDRSDLYALGVVFYEMLAGRQPFEANNLTTMLSQRLHTPVVPPAVFNEQIPPALNALAVQLLKTAPEQRPASAADVLGIINRWRTTEVGIGPESLVPIPQLNRLVRGRLVGRRHEFSQVANLWQQSVEGNGHVLLVSGEPGIGKTRLVQELTTYAELNGGLVLSAPCYADERLPYAPLADIFRNLREQLPGLALPEPVLSAVMQAPAGGQRVERSPEEDSPFLPEMEQRQLFESITTLFSGIAESSPLLLFLDDLHWADSGTLRIFHHLARRLGRRRLLLVGTYREVELDTGHPLSQIVVDLQRERQVTRVKLSRLDREQTQAMLATLFAAEITNDFADGIYHETEGNPFFIEEVCKALVDSGKLYFANGRWHRPAIDELEIPQGVQVAVQSRLARLSDEQREILQLAALLGREFRYEMLLAVAQATVSPGDGIGEETLISALENAEQGQLITEIRPSGEKSAPGMVTFSFTHALIKTILLSELSTLRRQRMQRRVALALENAYPRRLAELAPLLGRYFAEAGDSSKAITYLLQTGDTTRRLFAYDEAIRAYEQALLFLREEGEPRLASRTLMKLGLTYHNIFKFEQARKAYEEGFALWQRAPATVEKKLPDAPHPLRINLREPQTLDPTRSAHVSSSIIIQQLFSGLVEMTADQELIPDVAKRWEVLDGGRRYLFHLCDDVRWSDGRMVTSHDFRYAWLRALEPGAWPYPGELLLDIKGARPYQQGEMSDPAGLGISAPDEYTLVIELEEPSATFLYILAHTVALPVPSHVVEARGSAWTDPQYFTGNGPFVLEAYDPGRVLKLAPYAAYHRRFRGNLTAVEIYFLDSSDDSVALYRQNQLDCLSLAPLYTPEVYDRVRQRHPDEYISGPTPMVIFLALNVRVPPFNDRRVRRALAMAIDKETMAGVELKGLYPPADGGFVSPGMPGHVPGIGLPYDPERARKLIAQAGYLATGQLQELEGRLVLGDVYQVLGAALKDTWQRSLGLSVRFKPIQRGEIADLWLSAVAPDCPDPDSYLRVNNWSAASGWHHPEFDDLIDRARREADRETRMTMYHQAELILVQEAALIPLFYGRFHMLLKPWVTQYPVAPMTTPIWKEAVMDPSIEARRL